MVRFSMLAAAAALTFAAAPANAATQVDVDVSGTPGSTIGHVSLCNFNGTPCTRVTGGTVLPADVPGVGVMGNGTGFLNVSRNETAVVNLAGLNWRNFSFDLGTPDLFTSIVLEFVGGSKTFTALEIFGSPFPANNTIQRVAFSASSVITGVRIVSGGVATEADNMAGSVPEPGTWLLMILGLGAVGFAMRRRQSASVRLQFA